ncbi:DUF6642 family protein [Rhodococcus qingshengii]|uniref:DUF6642 family protein n=1 Tax=Rhodococcus qingshengii TaxID=334542 RepID=UPI000815F726|nr:hypothetical protein GA0061093_115138 [Rhodococcus qingshengii]
MTKPPGVLCLEGDWGDSLEDRMSIEPALRVLERSGIISLIHRDVATLAEFEHLVDRWSRMRSQRYRFLCLDFHGSPNTLHLGADDVTFDELGDILEGRCFGKTVYLGSCRTLTAPDDRLIEFCKQTQAKALVGYTRNVDWVESVAFELILISELTARSNVKPAYTAMRSKYPDLCARMGLRMAHSSWVSDRALVT